MPIVDVELVGGGHAPDGLAQQLVDALGEALEARLGATWLRLRVLPRDHYAESGGLDESVEPVFVTILERLRPTADDLQRTVGRVTAAVAAATGRDATHVHVLYDHDATGRLAFGGAVVEARDGGASSPST